MNESEIHIEALRLQPLAVADEWRARWNTCDMLTLPECEGTPYILGIAASDRCLEAAQRLRFEVFNLELGEGLAEAAQTGLDQDAFDSQMTHLVLANRENHRIVGTYRMQTVRHALRGSLGLYAAQQYDMTALEPYQDEAIELGRACLAEEFRSLAAIILLWKGIGAFMNLYDQHYLFGCSSITSTDPDDGWRAMKTIRQRGYLHESLLFPVLPALSCGETQREHDENLGEGLKLPKLFRTYMHLGARVVSEPAIDREFGTVDFLILMDGRNVHLSRLDILRP